MLIKNISLITREWEEAEGRAKRFFPTRWKCIITLLKNVNEVNIHRDKTKNERESHSTSPSMVEIFRQLRNGVKKTDWGYNSTA